MTKWSRFLMAIKAGTIRNIWNVPGSLITFWHLWKRRNSYKGNFLIFIRKESLFCSSAHSRTVKSITSTNSFSLPLIWKHSLQKFLRIHKICNSHYLNERKKLFHPIYCSQRNLAFEHMNQTGSVIILISKILVTNRRSCGQTAYGQFS